MALDSEDVVQLEGSDDSESGSDDDMESEESDLDDSDKELQAAFSKGLLKPGLNYAVPDLSKRHIVNNIAGLAQALIEIRAAYPVEWNNWPGRLDLIVKNKGTPNITEYEEVDDDFMRELSFLHTAQSAVLSALPRFKITGIPTRRPDDYLAEMAKSDEHMAKIRDKLASRRADLEARQAARQWRQLKKEGKTVQQEVLKRRLDEKKLLNEAVKKKLSNKDLAGDDEFEQALSNRGNNIIRQQGGPNKRREWKNSKFGFGGQKKRSKWNTVESAAGTTRVEKGKRFFINKNKKRPGKLMRNQRRRNATGKSGGGGNSKRWR